MKKSQLLIVAGVVTLGLGLATVPVRAVTFETLNVTDFIQNTAAKLKLKDAVRITKSLIVNRNINVKGEIKNTDSSEPVLVDDKLRVTKNVRIDGTVTKGIWNGTDIDVSDYTNLAAGTGLTLTGDSLSANLGTTIATGEIEDGAVTAAKLNDGAGSGVDADLLDGISSAGFQDALVQTIVVSPGASESASGTALRSALAGITDASATKPYLVKVEPGIYDIGSSDDVGYTDLTLPPFVHLEGSGEGATIIQGSVDTGDTGTGVLNLSSNTEVRFLTIKNDGEGVNSNTEAIHADTVSDFVLNHVTATAEASTTLLTVIGIETSTGKLANVTVAGDGTGASQSDGMTLTDSTVTIVDSDLTGADADTTNRALTMTNSTISVYSSRLSGAGGTSAQAFFFGNDTITASLFDVHAQGSGGTENFGIVNGVGDSPTVEIFHSVISGADAAIKNFSTATVRVGASQLDGGTDNTGGGTFTCVGAYDETFAALDASCA
jgi:hypothetical protein